MIRRRRQHTGAALVAIAALLLTACGPTEPELVRDPHPVGAQLPEVDTSGMRRPAAFEDLRVVDPGWDTEPQYADDVYLAAGQSDDMLEFTAVDVHGHVLWAAQRPVTCTGFVVTTDAQGRALAILTDVQASDDTLAGTTATAYDLTTGDLVWGPVDVPGPHQGPGLVFSAPPEGPMGDGGQRTALDPTTGRVIETASGPGAADMVGEYHGTLLLVDDDALIARRASDGDELWRIPLVAHGWTRTSIGPALNAAPHGLALIDVAGSGALLDLHDGTVLRQTAREAAVDSVTGTLVVLDDQGLHAQDDDRQPLWSLAATSETSIVALGGVLLYLREGGALRVHNVVTGEVAQAYDPHGQSTIIVPTHIAPSAAALLLDGRRHLLATIGQQPGSRHRE